ncbi:hypothetical protein Efla_006102 [Eimeria flavescens]
MAAAYDEKGSSTLDHFARALQLLKKDVDFLYNPRELPIPYPERSNEGKYPPGTGPLRRAPQSSPKTQQQQEQQQQKQQKQQQQQQQQQKQQKQPQQEQQQQSPRSKRPAAAEEPVSHSIRKFNLHAFASVVVKSQPSVLVRGNERFSSAASGKERKEVPPPVAALQRGPSAAYRGAPPPLATRRGSNLFAEAGEERATDEDQQQQEQQQQQVSRYSGTVVRAKALDEAVAAGGLAVTAAALQGSGARSSPTRFQVTIGDDVSLSEETESAEHSTPREQQEERFHPSAEGKREEKEVRADAAAPAAGELTFRSRQQELPHSSPLHERQAADWTVSSRRRFELLPGEAAAQQQPQSFAAAFPAPHSAAEMQRRLEEEWAERERRLKLQHQRHIEAVVAQEVEKVTQEYGRRLIFELQQQEQLLQTQFQQQNTHSQLREATDANWRLQQKAAELQQQLEVADHRLKAAEAEAQLLQQEAENSESRLQHLKAENVFLSSQVASLERQTFESKNREEDLLRRLQICSSNLEKLQEQLRHEQQVTASYAQRRKGLEKELDMLEHTKDGLKREMHAAAADSARFKGQAQALAAQNTQIISENDALKRKIQRLDMKIQEQLNTENDMLAKDRKIEDLQEQLDIQQKKNADVVASLRLRVQHLERFEWLYSTLKSEVENLKLETQRLRDENATLLAEARHRGQQDNTSQAETRSLQNELLAAQRENHLLRKDVQKLLKGAPSGGCLPAGLSSTFSFREATGNKTSPDNTLPGKAAPDCLSVPSIVPPHFGDCLHFRGPSAFCCGREEEDLCFRSRPDATSNHPIGRSTCPPPAMPSPLNPLTHAHAPSLLVRSSSAAVAAAAAAAPGGPQYMQQKDAAANNNLLLPEGVDVVEQMRSLDKQVFLLTEEKHRLEAELAKFPATNGTQSNRT